MRYIRLTRRQKQLRAVMLLCAVMILTISLINSVRSEKVSYNIYIVRDDDTLWDIAYRQYGDEVDIRDYIEMIEEINGIDGHVIKIGDKLLIPER